MITRNQLPLWIEQVMEREEKDCSASFEFPQAPPSSQNHPALKKLRALGLAFSQRLKAYNANRRSQGLPELAIAAKATNGSDLQGSIARPFQLTLRNLEARLQELELAPARFREFFFEGQGSDLLALTEEELQRWLKKTLAAYSLVGDWDQWATPENFQSMAANAMNDLRAYHRLFISPGGVDRAIAAGLALDPARSSDLAKLCENSGFNSACCQNALQLAAGEQRAADYLRFFKAVGESKWKAAFRIKSRNPNITLDSEAKVIRVPIWAKEGEEFQLDFKRLVELGWQRDGWRVEVQFVNLEEKAAGTVARAIGVRSTVVGKRDMLLPFETPLSGIAKEVQHEFGHILGFEDCYHGHLELDPLAVIYYAFDDSNLMCSLSGSFTEGMLAELLRVFKP